VPEAKRLAQVPERLYRSPDADAAMATDRLSLKA